MRILPALLGLALLATAPSAAATGWLVSVNGGGFGINPLGGRGDFLDVGVGNIECADEEDVVDVGIGNAEGPGGSACGSCTASSGTFFHPTVDATWIGLFSALGTTWKSGPGTCSDDQDVADVGVLNKEGNGQTCSFTGDRQDAVDVGLGNREVCDSRDGVDAGVRDCEVEDRGDAVDLGVGNVESVSDGDDTLDVSVRGSETGDGPDGNDVSAFATPPMAC